MIGVLRFTSRLLGGVAAVSIAWFLFADLAVAPLIESAYRGESYAFLNNLIGGSRAHSLETYLLAWEDMSARALGMLLVFGALPLPLALAERECQAFLDRGHPNPRVLRPVVFNSAIAVLGIVATVWLFLLEPVAYVHFIAEDSWAEYASFAAWGMASCFLLWLVIEDRNLRRAGPILLALGAFFVAMEEISWGQRVIGVGTPAFLAEKNFQSETNLHNLLPVESSQYLLAAAAIFAWVMLFPVLRDRSHRLRRLSDALGVPLVPVRLWPLFLLAMLALLSRSLLQSGEVGELFLAFAVSAFALDWILTERRGTEPALASTSAATMGLLTIQTVLALFLTEFYGSPGALSAKLNLFASSQLPAVGMRDQAIKIFEYMIENPRHLEWDTRIRYGLTLMELERFDEAYDVLESSLEDQRFLAQTRPKVPDHERAIGEVLAALDRPRQATLAFERAIEKDQARLAEVSDATAEAKVHWSLGNTYLVIGDEEAASRSLLRAVSLPSNTKTRHRLSAWMQENLDQDTYSTLIASAR